MSKNFFSLIHSDLTAAKKRDPAARTNIEIIFTYSGFHAIFGYRIAHFFWKIRLKFISRFLSNLVRIITSVEIHPAAVIGKGFFIDHGAGLVIGETCKIGENVTMYQQTTLGGISPSLDSLSQRNIKRHPTLEDGVIVGSGAQILGPICIGKNSRIGANAVVLKNVPANQTYIGIPARKVENVNESKQFDSYGITDGNIDDPNKKNILYLANEVHQLNQKIIELTKELDFFQNQEKDTKKVIQTKKNISTRKLK